MPGGGNLVRVERYRRRPRTPRSAHARYYYTRSLVLEQPWRGDRRMRCQSAPRVMDSHSRSASPRDQPRPQHRPPSPPSPAAFDNRGYAHDEADQNHNDSFASNPPQQNGHSKEPNGDTKALEAVNLELINLTPKNGSKKKEVEVDMNATNPYDEYFVPVNEHRKYMRGEKLYVTADKRGEKGGCKRPLCWTLLGLVVAAIVALIVLAATGVLFTNSPTTLEQYNTSISSARALGGISSFPEDNSLHGHNMHDHSMHDHSHDDHDDHATTPQTQSDEAIDSAIGSEEIGDASMYVPRTVEGELRIDNEEFTPEMQNPDSQEYQQFASTFSAALKRAIFDRNTIEKGDHNIAVEIIEIKNGSLIVTYRIHWTPKSNAESNEDLLTTRTLQTKLSDYLSKNDRMISTYHVAEDKIKSRQVLDLCKLSKNECQYNCEFDDTTLDFTCTCPPGQILDIVNPKKCISLFPSDEQSDSAFTTNTRKSMTEEEKPQEQTVERHNGHAPEPSPVAEPEPEPTSEPAAEPTTQPTGVIGAHSSGGTDEPSAEPTAEPSAEPAAEPAAEPSAEPIAELTTEPPAELAAEPTSEPAAEPSAEPAAEPSAVPAAESTDEPSAEPTAEPSTEPSVEPSAEPNAEPSAEPSTEPEAEQSAEPAAEPTADPTANPAAEPTAEPTTEPKFEPSATPKADPMPLPTAESSPERTAEPSAEPTPEPSTETTDDLSVEPVAKLKPNLSSESQSTTPKSLKEPVTDTTTTTSEPDEFKQLDIEFKLMNKHAMLKQLSAIEPEDAPEPEPTTGPKQTVVSKQNQNLNESNMDSVTTEKINKVVSIYESGETQETESDIKPNSYKNEIVTRNNKDVNVANVVGNMATTTGSDLTKDMTEVTTESEWLDNNQNQNIADTYKQDEFTQSRSFPSGDNEILAETTTIAGSSNEDISFNNLINENEKKDTMEESVTTTASVVTINELNEGIIINTSDIKSTAGQEVKSQEVVSLPETIDETTIEPEKSTQFSLNKLNNTEVDKNLLNALNTKAESVTKSESVPTTTENSSTDESMDITFEDIKETSFYNRSSKSITDENTTVQEIPEIKTTTESDWLVENITEVPYDEDINIMKKILTTENPLSKDELSNSGDFEPDYFTNIGTTNKMMDTDVPAYGMAQDYDGDLRVKRVDENKENKATPIMLEELVTKPNLKETTTEESPAIFASINSAETTTISDYIYKTAGRDTMPSSNMQPAPVWEQSESGTDINTTSSETNSQGNFNVYEVSNNNQNITFSTSSTNSHSGENDEHESENPFLPEVENNKHLVKKLQEGHDLLEPNNLNETQNENVDDHSVSVSDAQVSSSNKAATTFTENNESVTEAFARKVVNNNLLNESDKTKMNDANEMDSTSVISSFLMDTDDLDTNKNYATTTTADGMLKEFNSLPDELSVIPVVKNTATKGSSEAFEGENNLKLNDITSDSAENSDRTQKVTFSKIDSVDMRSAHLL